jgi:hypothetical protein
MKIQPTPWKIAFGKIIDAEGQVVCILPRRRTNDTAELLVAAPAMLAGLESCAGTLALAKEAIALAKEAIAPTHELLTALEALLPRAAQHIQGTTDGDPVLASARKAIGKARKTLTTKP